MAILALNSSASGLAALSTNLDVIANNLANVNTQGFKASRVNFQDLIYLERAQPGTENAIGDQRPTGLYVGLGVKVSGTQVDFAQGPPLTTDRELDIAIDGDGFLQVTVEPERAPGGVAYTRAGNLNINSDGELVLANDQGRRLEPGITIPDGTQHISISRDGRVSVQLEGEAEPQEVGQIQLARFINPAGLKQIGESLFTESAASGPPVVGNPDEEGRGGIQQGFLEGSNVSPTNELINLIRTQRAFEMNSQVIRAADETLQSVAQLRR